MEVVIFSTILLGLVFGVASDDDVDQKFRDFEIVPNIISKTPSSKLQVMYKDGTMVNLGEDINLLQTTSEPSVSFDGAEECKKYTLVMIDPDAPTPDAPLMAQFLHWLVTNIPADDVSQGKIIAGYVPPGAIDIPKPHRYIFLLYEQPDDIDVTLDPEIALTRSQFDVEDFAANYGLEILAAGNFFRESTGLKPVVDKVRDLL